MSLATSVSSTSNLTLSTESSAMVITGESNCVETLSPVCRNFRKITPEKRLILKYIFPGSELKALKGNEKVNEYYKQNEKMVRKIMKWDVLRLHRIIPASLLMKPYNWITTLMRKTLKNNVNQTADISTSDFYLDSAKLNEGWDIYVLAKKAG